MSDEVEDTSSAETVDVSVQTEETSDSTPPTIEESVVSDSEVEDEITIQAKEMGWRPKEEFTGSEHDWKGPGAFIKDAELFESLKKQSREIEELKTTLKDVKQFMTKSEEAGYKRAIAEVQAKRKEAIEMYDETALEKADDEYIKLQTELVSKNFNTDTDFVPKSQSELDFEVRNQDWYNDNTPVNAAMKREAILLSQSIAQSQPELSAEEHIQVLETKIRKLYPEKFKNTKRSEPSPVDTASKSKSVSSKDKINFSDIPPDVLDMGKRFVRQGVYKSVDSYLKDCKDMGII